MDLNKYENDEVYLLGVDSMSDTGELAAYDFFIGLKEHLSIIAPDTEPGLVALHGMLTSAKFIPGEIPDVKVWIILQNPSNKEEGCVIEASADGGVDMVAEEIEILLNGPKCPVDNITIDNVFLLYGYELNLGYGINEDEIDDDKLKICKEVVVEAK